MKKRIGSGVGGRGSCVVSLTQDAQRKAHGAKGFTLMEMLAVIVLMGVAIPPLLTTWADIAWRSGRTEAISDANFYAQDLMEEIKTKSFDERKINDTGPRWSNPGEFGPDSGEGARADYDDVDDFNTYSDAPASGYTRSVAVEYVRLPASNVWQACSSSCNNDVSDCSGCNRCCYKRVTVSVSRNDGLADNISLTTIVSSH